MKEQLAKKALQKSRSAPKQRKTRQRLVEFPQARGKTVDKVELSTDSDFPCVSIRFQDNTDLTVVIHPWLTFRANYSRWKDGNQKVLKRWAVFLSVGL